MNIVRIEMVKEREIPYKVQDLSRPESVAKLGYELLKKADRETFLVICVDSKNQINAVNVVSIGTLDQAIVHPREAFKAAILANAASVIFMHNHPSGSTDPSKADIELTKILIDAGKLLCIRVHDHLIIGDNQYYSFAEEGKM